MNFARKARALALTAVMASAAAAAHGQAIYGSLYGTVTDPSGAAIPNATVVVTDISKGTSVTVQANANGEYTVEHLIPDSYSIKVTASGFTTFETTGINVSADSAPKVDAKLSVGDAGTIVQVNAGEIPALVTDRAEVATTFNARNTEDLPLPNRNFTGLQLLLPGTQLLGWSHASSENPQGSQQIIVNGQHFAGVAYELDGTDNQDPILGIIVVNPSLDSVKESKIATQNYDAQFGKAVAAVITAQTKSGGNSVHGGVFDFRQSDAQYAKNPFNAPDILTGRIVPKALQNQFGGSIGLPIQKDRVFLFADYQGVRSKVGTSTGKNTVPTTLLRSSCAGPVGCDFSEYVGTVTPVIVNPQTGLPYANNVIPKAQLNPAAVSLLERLPAPNTSTVGTPFQNYSALGTGGFNYDQGTIRLDAQVTDGIHYFNRFSYFSDVLTGPTAFGALGGPGFGTGGYGGTSKGHNASWATGFDVVVSPKWVTDVRFGFLRYSIATSKYDGNEAFATNNGIPGLNGLTGNTGGAPEFDIGGVPNNALNNPGGNFGSGLGVNRCNCPLTENERQYQVANNWTHELGNHSIKFGVDLRHAYNLRIPSDQNRAGILVFNPQTTAQAGTGGLGYATFVLGDVSQFQRYASTSTNASETQNRAFGYVQDTWRVNPKLTVNYGTRYETYLPEKVEKDQGAILNLDTGNLQVAHEGPYAGDMGTSNNYSAIAPRVGLAYQFNQKTVIRAGYGRSFDIGVFGSIFGHAVSQNLPVLSKQQVTSSGNQYVFQLGGTPPAANFGSAPVNGNIRLPDGINANARPTTERFPTIDAWNAEVQRDLGHQFTLTVAYVGNKGTHTFTGDGSTKNPNQVGVVQNGLAFNPLLSTGVLQNPAAPRSDQNDPRRRFYQPRFGWTQDINYFASDADTNFEALQATFEKRFSQGYQFVLNYAYQKAHNYSNTDLYQYKVLTYGNQDDLRQSQLTFFGNLELPFGRGHALASNDNSFVDRFINGWEVSPTFNLASGLPFWPSYANAGVNKDQGPSEPNYSGSGFKTGLKGQDFSGNLNYFTPGPDITKTTGSVFTNPGYLKFGNLQRNSFFGPGFANVDAAIQKTIQVRESTAVIFRTDFFNVLNHMNYANPNTNIDSNDPSLRSGLGGGGQITQLAGGPDQAILPRHIQFGIRVKF